MSQKKSTCDSFIITNIHIILGDVYLFFPNLNQKTRSQPSIICWNPDAVFCRKWPSDVCFYRFWRFRCFAISVSVTFVVTPTISWVWTLSDVCCRLVAKRFSPHDLRWRQIVKIFNCLFCYTESLYWTLCTHYEHCSSYMNRNLKIFEYESIFLFFDHLLCLFFFFKHNKLLTRKLEFLLFSTSWTPVQLHISSSASKTWTSEQSSGYWADDCIMLRKRRGLVSVAWCQCRHWPKQGCVTLKFIKLICHTYGKVGLQHLNASQWSAEAKCLCQLCHKKMPTHQQHDWVHGVSTSLPAERFVCVFHQSRGGMCCAVFIASWNDFHFETWCTIVMISHLLK